MGPRKPKRARPNPSEASTASLPTIMPSQPSSNSSRASQLSEEVPGPAASIPTLAPLLGIGQESSQQDTSADNGHTPTPRTTSKQAHKTRSWYGSWPRVPKSSASTQVARETILGGTSKPRGTADFSRFDTRKSVDNMSLDGVPESDSASVSTLPGVKDSADTANAEVPKAVQDVPDSAPAKAEDVDIQSGDDNQQQQQEQGQEQEQDTDLSKGARAAVEPEQRPTTASGWLGWFGRPTNAGPTVPEPVTTASSNQVAILEEPTAVTASEAQSSEPRSSTQPEQQPSDPPEAPTQPAMQERPTNTVGSSWFGIWSSSAVVPSPQSAPSPQVTVPEVTVPEAPSQPSKEPEDVVMEDVPPADPIPTPPPKAGSTWAFWSRDTGTSSAKKPTTPIEPGQLAVIGEGSEAHPQNANTIAIKDTPDKEPQLKPAGKGDQLKGQAPTPKESSKQKVKRGRPQSMDLDELPSSRPSTPKSDHAAKAESSAKAAAAKTPTSVKSSARNLLLPAFTNTYQVKENPSLVQQITRLLLRTQQPPSKHVFLSKETPKIKRALAIGVHGLFPANYLRPMIGQPTGTSIKFANHCAEAIRRWADTHGSEDCEIEKVALEGEGKIGERVENLWKLLLNWIDHIRNADLIIIGCHSQGVPVSIMLLAKLLDLGIVTTAKVGVCAMAGVSLGPFPDYRSGMGILMGSAGQLWEFADPQSEVSKRLESSMKVVLSYGTRITLVGSIDDQLVPLESAIYAPAHHPHIYRAVFIDGRVHAPDFIAHLVGFALKLRNLGITDHGLIRELSVPLAGSLYSGEGHSRLYDDEQVYDLAVTHALETTSVGNVPCEIHHNSQQGNGLSAPNNPYLLPWIMRGLLEEEFVKSELYAETQELLRQFDDWKPVTKGLKDVKYRLEAVRSKL
ncbi:hypothetical protein B0H66DRAFT_601681 [Apodospora peruviana]|uniref:YMC020W-like alpha/beta hydrolase domain-containing protein n=1 Tax=Apodospora peruviana TaxID=516989 RepID=A0AAE0IC49_9PEZI|nr:hypothetical protein B0H66DRAFT_601681 [Apodospora peruviana]